MAFLLSKLLWFLLQPSSLLLLAIAFGLLRARRPGCLRSGLRIASWGLALLCLVGFSSIGYLALLPLEQRFPATRVPADARDYAGIIVLGGAEDGRISVTRGQLHINEAGERITEAARLARLLPATRIAFTGGVAIPLLGQKDGAPSVGAWWQAMGIAADRIVLEDRSRNTLENALLLKPLLAPKPGERFLLVTSAAHMPRSMGVFRRAGYEVTAYPGDFRTAGTGDLWEISLGLTGGLKRLDEAAKEWVGLAAYRLMGRTNALFPAP